MVVDVPVCNQQGCPALDGTESGNGTADVALERDAQLPTERQIALPTLASPDTDAALPVTQTSHALAVSCHGNICGPWHLAWP